MKKIFLLLALSATTFAQHSPCGLTSITETTPLLYPPIAKAAHVGGTMIFPVSFKQSGAVENVEVLSGPKLLTIPATTYVRGLRANEYGGPRNCPIVVQYQIQPDGMETKPIEQKDIQHVTVFASPAIPIAISDPASKIIRRPWPFNLHKPKHLD
jgi:hypothetical protein